MRRLLGVVLLGAVACAAPLHPLPPPAAGAAPADPAALATQAQEAARQVGQVSSADERSRLVDEAVQAGQRCQQAAPATPACDYALALALGVQARERRSTATQGLKVMVELLQRANSNDPRMDHAGPSRVLALVLLRVPGWPLGPGDPEAGLKAAHQAVELFPDYAGNQLALSEALLVTGAQADSQTAAALALQQAQAAKAAGDRDADTWLQEAQSLLAGRSPR